MTQNLRTRLEALLPIYETAYNEHWTYRQLVDAFLNRGICMALGARRGNTDAEEMAACSEFVGLLLGMGYLRGTYICWHADDFMDINDHELEMLEVCIKPRIDLIKKLLNNELREQ